MIQVSSRIRGMSTFSIMPDNDSSSVDVSLGYYATLIVMCSYLDTTRGDGRDLFFYFFESRGDPKNDPVIMWINGMSSDRHISGNSRTES